MKLKKMTALGVAIILTLSSLVGCGNNKTETKEGKTIKVGMISDVGGINDESFNQSAWEGLQKAKEDLDIEVKVIESKQASEYVGNIETLADQGIDLIIGVGNTMSEAIKSQAENYPDQSFAIIDETYDQIPSNVTPILFKENEASYLTGLIAGKMTKTNNVGFIGGMQISVIDTFKYGFMAGVKAANPDAELQAQYANSFTDQAKGKAIATQMYKNGADIIFTAGGDVGTGAIESARELGKYAIGVDRDQSDLAPENVITSAIKRVDAGVFETVKDLAEGKFEGGSNVVYGLNENAVGIADTTSNLVSQDILDYVNEQMVKFQNGELTAPKNEEEYNALVK